MLCVSDKPLHGKLQLPEMADDYYKTQAARHFRVGIQAMEYIREMPLARIQSRKLRRFKETSAL